MQKIMVRWKEKEKIKFNKNELKGSVAAVFFVLFVLFRLRIVYFVILNVFVRLSCLRAIHILLGFRT